MDHIISAKLVAGKLGLLLLLCCFDQVGVSHLVISAAGFAQGVHQGREGLGRAVDADRTCGINCVVHRLKKEQ